MQSSAAVAICSVRGETARSSTIKRRPLLLLRLLTALALLSPTVSRTLRIDWDSRFTAGSGTNGTVVALAERGDFIYAGGNFTTMDS